jgi:uracil-DNA glycosylase
MIVIDELNTLYEEIRACHICPKMDKEKALRLVRAVNPKNDVFIISQTLAADQLRRSGVDFFQADGKLGNTGATLEKFLNRFNRTAYPYQEVVTLGDTVIPKCTAGSLSVYNTEIAQCYPGRNRSGKGDRLPKSDEIYNCISKGFLIKEIQLMKPTLVLLMGKASRDSFFKHILHVPYPNSLSAHIDSIVESRAIPYFYLGGIGVYVLPIQHSSGANPRFYGMMNNDRLVELVVEALE